MRSVCFNPLSYLDSFCADCQFIDICECDLKMIGGKQVEVKKRKKKEVEVVEQVVHNKVVNKFDIDI